MPEYNNFIKKEGDAQGCIYILQGAMMNTVIGSTNDLASLIDRINTIVFQNYNTKLLTKNNMAGDFF